MTKENETQTSKFQMTRGKIIALSVGAVAILGSAVAVPAIANSNVAQHAKIAISDMDQNHVYKAGWGGKRSSFSQMSEADLEKKVTKIARHMSVEIDATEAQEKQIIEIALATAKEMQPLRDEFKAAGFELVNLLTSDNVDRVAIETLRTERLAAADTISKTMLDAVSEVSEILTVEQRQGLAKRVERMQKHFND